MDAFKQIFNENPDILIRVIQVIMIRLQRVTFTALRNYLGLHSELVQTRPHKRAAATTTGNQGQTAPNIPSKGSPTYYKRPSTIDTSLIHTLSAELADASRPDMLADLSEVRSSSEFIIEFRNISSMVLIWMISDFGVET